MHPLPAIIISLATILPYVGGADNMAPYWLPRHHDHHTDIHTKPSNRFYPPSEVLAPSPPSAAAPPPLELLQQAPSAGSAAPAGPAPAGAAGAPADVGELPECIPDEGFRKAYPGHPAWMDEVCDPGFERAGFPAADPFIPPGTPRRTLQQLLTLLAGHRVALHGDSIMSQVFKALMCEGSRTRLLPQDGTSHLHALHQALVGRVGSGVQVAVMRAAEGSAPVGLIFRRDNLLNEDYLGSDDDSPRISPVGADWRAWGVTVGLLNAGLHYHYNRQLDDIVKGEGEVRYGDDLAATLEEVERSAPEVVPVWVETTAQHFQSAEGAGWYDALIGGNHTCGCMEIDAQAAKSARQSYNRVSAEVVARRARWRVLRFFDLTAPRAFMHNARANNFGGGCGDDCTHHCYSPRFWEAVWGTLYEVLLAAGVEPIAA